MYNELEQENFAYGIMEETHLRGTVYGYIRVSTKEQNEDRQRIAMEEAGVPERNVYMDKQSGKDFNRPQYRKLLRKLKKTICSMWGASTVWGATMRRFCSNGGILPRTRGLILWCWICRCWIPAGEKT